MFCLVAGSFTSCVSKKKYDELTASKEATDQALAETQAQVKTLQEDNEELQSKYEEDTQNLRNEIQSVRTDMEQQIASVNQELSVTKEELETMRREIADVFNTYQAADLGISERNGELYLTTSAPIQFRSSSTSLSKEERDAIDALAEKMKDNENLRILVEGHTDTKMYPDSLDYDNWDLSWDRAKNVAARLISQGVSPEQVTVSGRGQYDPLQDNSTSEGRAANRRTSLKPNPAMGNALKAIGVEVETNSGGGND